MRAKFFCQFIKRINSVLLYTLVIKFCLNGRTSWADMFYFTLKNVSLVNNELLEKIHSIS